MRRRRSSARSSNRGTSGFTLVEMLVAFSIASVVVVAVGSGFVFVTKSWTDQLGRVQTQQALRTTVESLTREMRLAGACMPSPTLPPIATTYDPYQPLAGSHGTTDSITITSNPACAGPTSVTSSCNACTSIIVQDTTNFTAGTWAYIYNSDTTTSPPGPYGESFLIQSVNAGTGTITVSPTKLLLHNYPAVSGGPYKSALRGMDQRVFAISSACAGCNGVPSLTLTPIGGQAQPLVKRNLLVGWAGLEFKHAVTHTFDGVMAGDFAGQRAAHAVADREQRAVVILRKGRQVRRRLVVNFGRRPGVGSRQVQHEKVIFITRPHHADVGHSVDGDVECVIFRHKPSYWPGAA